MDSATLAVLGLDVSKAKIDCALLVEGKFRSKVVRNSSEGFEDLDHWLIKQGISSTHACCEATGIYHESLAMHLADAGHRISIVNPARIADYAKAQLTRAKTDRADARLIAQFCQRERPDPWVPPPRAERVLLALVRDLHAVQSMHTAEHHRLESAHEAVRPRILAHLEFLEADIARLKERIADHIDRNDDLRGRRDLLDSIPGIGDATIAWLLAYLGDGTRFDAKQVAAFAGLAPRLRQSGSSLNHAASIAKTGHADLRRALYMPGVVALSRTAYAPFVRRLKQRGKPGKLIVIALMRKLLTIANAVLRSRQPFDSQRHLA